MKNFKDNLFHGHVDTEGTWAISYGDMITLLLSFFVIFFSTDFKKEKEEKLQESVVTNLEKGDYTKSLNDKFSTTNDSVIPDEVDLSETVVKKMSNGDIYIFFPNISFFKSGMVSLSQESNTAVDKVSQSYMPYAANYKLKVQAFTDDVPVKSGLRFKDNVELSLFRSLSVMRELEKKGVPTDRMELGGKGVFNQKLVKVINGNKEMTQKRMEALSRTVAFVLVRENAE